MSILEQAIEKVREATRGGGYEGRLYLVGGLIRDRLLDLPPEQDVDIVCLTDALEVAEHLHSCGITDHSPVVYPRFGTAMVSVDGVNVELVTARRESYEEASRKPHVEPGTLEDDVLRRDFTINTLLEHLHTGGILDLTGRGLADLKAGVIRTPLDPVITFRDDPLRMLRAVRFATRFRFRVEPEVYQAIVGCAERLKIISMERIRDEFLKTLMLANASQGMNMLSEAGLLRMFAPELEQMKGVTQNIYHLYDVWDHTMMALDHLPEDATPLEKLTMLFHDVGKPGTRTEDEEGGVHFYGHQQLSAEMTREILHRLKFPNDVVHQVERMVALHMRIGEYSDRWSDSAVRRLVRDLGDELDPLFRISDADKAACNPEYHYLDSEVVRRRIEDVQKEADYAHVESPLDGREIMGIAGIGPGPDVGRFKDMLINEMLEGRLKAGDAAEAERILREAVKRERG